MEKATSILFVCLGNIIRSPLAARLFEYIAEQEGIGDKYHVESAGTGGWHAGETPDERMVRTAAKRGFDYTNRARQVNRTDLSDFDLIIAMDLENKADLERTATSASQRVKIHLLREFDPEANGDIAVPDPWYGGPAGFDEAYDIIERSVSNLLDALEAGKLKLS